METINSAYILHEQGYSYREISRLLNCSVSTAHDRAHKEKMDLAMTNRNNAKNLSKRAQKAQPQNSNEIRSKKAICVEEIPQPKEPVIRLLNMQKPIQDIPRKTEEEMKKEIKPAIDVNDKRFTKIQMPDFKGEKDLNNNYVLKSRSDDKIKLITSLIIIGITVLSLLYFKKNSKKK